MFKIIYLWLVLLISLFGLEDLGTYGSTNTIKEKNFMDEVEEKAKDINVTLLQEQLIKGEDTFLTVKKIVPTCVKTQRRSFIPTFIVPADIIMPDGKIIARAGEIHNTLEVMKKNNIVIDRYMMFIDSQDEIQVQLSYMYQNQGYVFITNGSIKEYEEKTKISTFKADKISVEKFNIKCSPSLVIQQDNELIIYEYNPRELANKDNEK
jgi:conjugal transfer pilus assembly protein TraW